MEQISLAAKNSWYPQILKLTNYFFPYSRRKNIEGKLTVNGRERDSKKFRRQTAYIMQDHEVQPLLTIAEAMHFSANLKIGDEMTQPNKKKRVSHLTSQ